MYFNFPLFETLATKAYRRIGGSTYRLEEVLEVFRLYFDYYEHYTRRTHPNIRMEQIERIIFAMPQVNSEIHDYLDIDADDYETLIDKHFKTEYNIGYGGCDYNINHFFSGDVRAMRFYEELY